MIETFRKILELTLFPPNEPGGVILIADYNQDQLVKRENRTSFEVPRELFPESCEVLALPPGEQFIEASTEVLSQSASERLFLVPPFLAFRHLSNDIRKQFPGMNLEEIVLRNAIDSISPGSIVGLLFPWSFFVSERSRDTRNWLIEKGVLEYLIAHDFSPQRIGIDVHPAFQFQTFIYRKGHTERPNLHFFKVPDVDSSERQEEVLTDLKILGKIQGGTTRHGYILRESIPVNRLWSYDALDPALTKLFEDMQHFGNVIPLGDLVEIHHGLNQAIHKESLIDRNSENADALPVDDGVPVVDGRSISSDNNLLLEETRYRLVNETLEGDFHLQLGDICVRKMVGFGDNLRAVLIEEEMLPLVAESSVTILRPKANTAIDLNFMIDYLRSDSAMQYLRAHGMTMQVHARSFQDLPVPVPDEVINTALEELRKAVSEFQSWKDMTDRSISSLFTFHSAKDARLHLLSTGRRVRQMLQAAQQVDELEYRVRTQYPHPIAYRWRTVEAAKPDLEGYLNVLDTAEVITCYLACVAILAARSVSDSNVGYLKTIATKLTRKKHGTGFGDWLSILLEVWQSKKFKNTKDPVAFYEVTRFLDDEETEAALRRLKKNRDDQAHQRGPKGAGKIARQFEESKSDLKKLIAAIEFLSEYRLLYIEEANWDSFSGEMHYTYRELAGDHPLVPLSYGKTNTSDIEAKSLYLVDRDHTLHLLRPLLVRRECPECGQWRTFYLDKYSRSPDGEVCSLKGMEQGHPISDAQEITAFKRIGLLADIN